MFIVLLVWAIVVVVHVLLSWRVSRVRSLTFKPVCTCSNGTAAVRLGCGERPNVCTACNKGYTLKDGKCVPNQCTCQNGTAASGLACRANSGRWCSECNEGYALIGGLCTPKQCICAGGKPRMSSGDLVCSKDRAACVDGGCDAGYHNAGGVEDALRCVKNICTCSHGTAATGAACIEDKNATCASCNSGYDLQSDVCVLRRCTCPNGTPSTGAECSAVGNLNCVSCDTSFNMVDGSCEKLVCNQYQVVQGNKCVNRVCTCIGGTPPAQCTAAGASTCERCSKYTTKDANGQCTVCVTKSCLDIYDENDIGYNHLYGKAYTPYWAQGSARGINFVTGDNFCYVNTGPDFNLYARSDSSVSLRNDYIKSVVNSKIKSGVIVKCGAIATPRG